MALKISDEISNRAWGDVDKSAIWRRLKKGLQEGEEGVKEAIREMYAVLKAEINEDLTQADCFGPHHEIRGDSLVLNRGGVIACYQSLRGARAEPNLSPEQKSKAFAHIRRHYKDLGLEMEGEIYIEAQVAGEMSVEDIPISPSINVDELKKGDDDPLEVVVAIPVSTSKRGWRYSEQALRRIVDAVNQQGLPGALGHQEPDKVNYEFVNPVTHWIGAKFENGIAYIRGIIDKSAQDLKRWIRAGVIKNVSIFGVPTLKQANGETEVIDFMPLSIDWTPLGRNGMPTSIVAMGEQDLIGGATELTKDEYIEAKKIVGELVSIYGVEASELVSKIKEDKAKIEELKRAERQATIDKVVGEMVKAVELHGIVKRLIPDGVEGEEAIRKAVGEILASEEVKVIADKIFVDTKIDNKKADTKILETIKVKI